MNEYSRPISISGSQKNSRVLIQYEFLLLNIKVKEMNCLLHKTGFIQVNSTDNIKDKLVLYFAQDIAELTKTHQHDLTIHYHEYGRWEITE